MTLSGHSVEYAVQQVDTEIQGFAYRCKLGLTQKSHEKMSDVRAVSRLRQDHPAKLGQPASNIEFAIGEQAGIRSGLAPTTAF